MRRVLTALTVLTMVLAACAGTDDGATSDRDGDRTTDEDEASSRLPTGPSALDDMEDPAFPEPLVDPREIISGGPPPDGIPPIDEPAFTPTSEVDFLDDAEPVLVVEIAGEARIYPVQIMIWHEIVNDEIGGVPVTVSYCPLCNSAVTYDRRVDVGRGEAVLDFGTSGRLFNSALVMYDRQTESLWSHFTGQAVVGVLTGVELDLYPTTTVGWAAARAAHPDALVLNTDTGVPRAYGQNPYPGYDDVTTSPFLFDGEVDGRLVAKARVVGIREGDGIAVRRDALGVPGVLDIDGDDAPLTVWATAGTASALDTADIAFGRDVGAVAVFHRRLDGETLAFELVDGAVRDVGTGSTWGPLGQAIDGPLAGERLTPVEHVDTFWFAWASFLPDTRVVPPVGA